MKVYKAKKPLVRCEVCLENFVHKDKCPNYEKPLTEFDKVEEK